MGRQLRLKAAHGALHQGPTLQRVWLFAGICPAAAARQLSLRTGGCSQTFQRPGGCRCGGVTREVLLLGGKPHKYMGQARAGNLQATRVPCPATKLIHVTSCCTPGCFTSLSGSSSHCPGQHSIPSPDLAAGDRCCWAAAVVSQSCRSRLPGQPPNTAVRQLLDRPSHQAAAAEPDASLDPRSKQIVHNLGISGWFCRAPKG